MNTFCPDTLYGAQWCQLAESKMEVFEGGFFFSVFMAFRFEHQYFIKVFSSFIYSQKNKGKNTFINYWYSNTSDRRKKRKKNSPTTAAVCLLFFQPFLRILFVFIYSLENKLINRNYCYSNSRDCINIGKSPWKTAANFCVSA